jgi:biopolymer transport protein ExbD
MAVQLKKGGALDVVNMTPMIDCIFQLLLFFMLAAQFKDTEPQEIPAPLPSASSAAPLTSEPAILLDIDRDGNYSIQKHTVARQELVEVLRQAAADNRLTTKVRIRADKDGALEHAVRAMDMCKQAGLEYTLVTEGPAR